VLHFVASADPRGEVSGIGGAAKGRRITDNKNLLNSPLMTEQTELLREIRDLLQVIAEPALAKRDEKLRLALLEIVGKSKPKQKAALLMDGTRSQSAIQKESKMDAGNLSRFVKTMRAEALIGKNDKESPKLAITIPPNFFD
jgi:hypothetical protein